MEGLTISRLPCGDLRLHLSSDGREELKEFMARAHNLDHDVLADMLERHAANGLYYPINSEFTFVGLTSAPVITDDLHHDDDGTEHVRGNLWWFERYQIESFAQTLLANGEVVFPLGAPAPTVTRQ
jgi:hypothetical protein